MARVLTPRAEDFPRWYQDVIAKAELADNGPVRGTMVIRPTGYAIWERMQAEMDARIKAAGARERLLPAVHPRELPASARPSTSRASRRSWRWSPTAAASSSTSRWWSGPPARRSSASSWPSGSARTATCRCCSTSGPTWCAGSCGPRIFLRTSEFLWQEGHTAHATEADARAYARRILHEVYEDFMVNVLGIPVRGRAQDRPGALRRRDQHLHPAKAMMGDGKALQMGTSHELGQNFAKAFDITYSGGRRQAASTPGPPRGAPRPGCSAA